MPEKLPAVSIFEQLISGSKTFNSIEELRKALHENPDDPWLFRVMGDFLKRGKSFIEAHKAYHKSYLLFMEHGQSLQAIAALLRGWAIIRPSAHDFRSLHSRLRRKNSHSSAIAECFAKMSYQELTDTLKRITLVKYPANRLLGKSDDSEEPLFFVVYGSLLASTPADDGSQENAANFLQENDFFGERYPRSDLKSLEYLVKTLTEVELIKITKPTLLTLCGKHPELQTGLKTLLKDHDLAKTRRPNSTAKPRAAN